MINIVRIATKKSKVTINKMTNFSQLKKIFKKAKLIKVKTLIK